MKKKFFVTVFLLFVLGLLTGCSQVSLTGVDGGSMGGINGEEGDPPEGMTPPDGMVPPENGGMEMPK
jgi:hypothetical protein